MNPLPIWDLLNQQAVASVKPMTVKPGGIPNYLARNEEPQQALSQAPSMPPPPPHEPQPGGMDLSALLVPRGKSPEEAEMEKVYRQGLDRQSQISKGYEDQLAQIGDKPTGFKTMDLSPIAGLVDSWTGSNLAQSYKAPTAGKEWEAKKAMLQDALQKSQGQITDDQLAFLKMKSDQRSREDSAKQHNALMMMNADTKRERNAISSDRLLGSVYGAFDNDAILKKYSQQKAGIYRAAHTLENPPQGKVTTQLLKEVSTDIANALTMGAQTAESDREAQEYKSLATKWTGIQSYLSNEPEGVAAPDLIDYLKENLNRLDEGFATNMAGRAREIASGRQYGSAAANTAVQSKLTNYSGGGNQPTQPPAKKPAVKGMSFEDFVAQGG